MPYRPVGVWGDAGGAIAFLRHQPVSTHPKTNAQKNLWAVASHSTPSGVSIGR